MRTQRYKKKRRYTSKKIFYVVKHTIFIACVEKKAYLCTKLQNWIKLTLK